MNLPKSIETERLVLRHWSDDDVAPFAAMNADPAVMEHFPSVKSSEESLKEFQSIQDHFQKRGYGFWAVSEKQGSRFIGFIGLRYIDFDLPFTPAVEIGWRLAKAFWGKGYATEGAMAALKFGFDELLLKEIVSFTAKSNVRSQRVMEKIGMRRDVHGDFQHPKLPKGHPLRSHVLFRISGTLVNPVKVTDG
jgi:RimJ/RimL family protein N-acetyltransferase